jgi:Cof subfamily protein (haloacid dehalogenase superfamily)
MVETIISHFDELRQLLSEKGVSSFKMVALDMDGTLLNRDHQLSDRTIASVKMIADAGLTVLLATGRMTSAVKNHLEKLGTPGLVVSHNGALVKDVRTGKIYHHETVPKEVVTKVLELLDGKKTVIHFNFDDNIYLAVSNPYSERYSQELQVSLTYASSLKCFEGEPTSILLMDNQEVLKQVLTTVSNDFLGQFDYVMAPWQSNVWRLQFLATNTSKGKGVLQVAKRLGVKPEEIISFGDSYNDMDMLQHTGLGIAMGNAVPELKQVADFVTFSNQEDGVAYVLEALFKSWNK